MTRDTLDSDNGDATIFAPAGGGRRAPERQSPRQPSPGQGGDVPFPQASPSAGTRPPPDLGPVSRSYPSTWDSDEPAAEGLSAASRAVEITVDHSDALPTVSDVYNDNPGLALAAPIFEQLLRVRGSSDVVDVPSLHRKLMRRLSNFETQAAARGLAPRHVRLILYALAATVDDIVLRTKWGQESRWSTRTMISLFFQESWGGERFFTLLSQMMASPQSFMKEIEVFYYCIEFGFVGKYRLDAGGSAELTQISDDVYKFLRGIRGFPQPELSPSWRGVTAHRGRLRDLMPFWLAAAGFALILLVVFVVLSAILRRDAEIAAVKVSELLADPVETPAPPPPPPPVRAALPVAPAEGMLAPPPTTPPAIDPYRAIAKMLMPQQQQGLISVLSRSGTVVIITRKELFASASTTLRTPYPDVIKAIAEALQPFPGPIAVTGFTDSLPINTPAFPNNEALSLARAKRVAQLLSEGLSDPARVSAFGRGAADPIATNATPDGRATNRRVEIVLTPR